MSNLLPLPSFFSADNAHKASYSADLMAIATVARDYSKANAIRPAATDRRRVHLLAIDAQIDFCFPSGSLYVAGQSGTGAMDDNARLARFIYENLGHITEITPTLDTHFKGQIFFPDFWVDEQGQMLHAHDQIDGQLTIHRMGNPVGKAEPAPWVAHRYANGNFTWMRAQAKFYCQTLEATGKYRLYLWPYHCILGTQGHALAGVIAEALAFHAITRNTTFIPEVKGGNPLTECYSVLGPEVIRRHDGGTLDQKNAAFLGKLLKSDALIIAGQASSHCVKSTIDDLLGEILKQDPDLAKKVYILRDCMSSVVIPGVVDFTPEAEAAFQRFAAAGMNIVESTTPLNQWPGF